MTPYEYRQLLRFLYAEGYADTYENAEYLLESISQNEFDSLYESVIVNSKIMNHLLSEGYAHTEEQAEQILIHMSEDWRFSILTEAAKDQSDKQIEQGLTTSHRASSVLANQGSRGLSRLPSHERAKKSERMLARIHRRREELSTERNRREDERNEKYRKLLGL